MNPTLITLMVAHDAGESGDEATRVALLDELVDVLYVRRVLRRVHLPLPCGVVVYYPRSVRFADLI